MRSKQVFRTKKNAFPECLGDRRQQLAVGRWEYKEMGSVTQNENSDLVSAGIEFLFFLVAGTECFGFSVRIMLITC